jgi:hypothetical protein
MAVPETTPVPGSLASSSKDGGDKHPLYKCQLARAVLKFPMSEDGQIRLSDELCAHPALCAKILLTLDVRELTDRARVAGRGNRCRYHRSNQPTDGDDMTWEGKWASLQRAGAVGSIAAIPKDELWASLQQHLRRCKFCKRCGAKVRDACTSLFGKYMRVAHGATSDRPREGEEDPEGVVGEAGETKERQQGAGGGEQFDIEAGGEAGGVGNNVPVFQLFENECKNVVSVDVADVARIVAIYDFEQAKETFGQDEKCVTTEAAAKREVIVVIGSVLLSRLEDRWNDECREDHTLQLYLRLALFAIKTNLQGASQARAAGSFMEELFEEEDRLKKKSLKNVEKKKNKKKKKKDKKQRAKAKAAAAAEAAAAAAEAEAKSLRDEARAMVTGVQLLRDEMHLATAEDEVASSLLLLCSMEDGSTGDDDVDGDDGSDANSKCSLSCCVGVSKLPPAGDLGEGSPSLPLPPPAMSTQEREDLNAAIAQSLAQAEEDHKQRDAKRREDQEAADKARRLEGSGAETACPGGAASNTGGVQRRAVVASSVLAAGSRAQTGGARSPGDRRRRGQVKRRNVQQNARTVGAPGGSPRRGRGAHLGGANGSSVKVQPPQAPQHSEPRRCAGQHEWNAHGVGLHDQPYAPTEAPPRQFPCRLPRPPCRGQTRAWAFWGVRSRVPPFLCQRCRAHRSIAAKAAKSSHCCRSRQSQIQRTRRRKALRSMSTATSSCLP